MLQLNKGVIYLGKIIHGKTHTRLYNIYKGMKRRCYNKTDKDYKDYGGRDITICDEWLNDFMSFYNWSMNNGYDESLTIDRMDNNKGYSPDNCRWVDVKTQSNNTRRNVYLTYCGLTLTLAEWSRKLKVNRNTLKWRYRRGYTDKECLFGKEVKANGKN